MDGRMEYLKTGQKEYMLKDSRIETGTWWSSMMLWRCFSSVGKKSRTAQNIKLEQKRDIQDQSYLFLKILQSYELILWTICFMT